MAFVDKLHEIPIFISLTYNGNSLLFPINPESLEKDRASNSETVNIEGIGEVSVPTSPKLATISIKSFFWQEKDLLPSEVYVGWLERWQRSKRPATLVVTRLNYSMQVTCENFRHWINAGEEGDTYFELQMKEYRPYGARKLNAKNQKIYDIISTTKDVMSKLPGFFSVSIPRPIRNNSKKEEIKNPYITKENETILTITKKITGSTDDWKLLYDNNIEILGDLIAEGSEIKVGTSLVLPKEWVDNEAYNIQVDSNV